MLLADQTIAKENDIQEVTRREATLWELEASSVRALLTKEIFLLTLLLNGKKKKQQSLKRKFFTEKVRNKWLIL